jgi:predicted amidophosphoribosyltransferase
MSRGCAAGLASPALVRADAAGHDRDRKKDAILALKYGRLYPGAGRRGGGLARAMTQQADEARAQMSVVPILQPQQKQEQHRFTLTRMLAESMLPVLEKPRPQWRMTLVSKALLRQRRTESQAGLTAPKRRLNMRRAFVVSDLQAVRGKQILPVDDILTTGARARAAERILLQPGTASVWVATLAWARRQLNELRTTPKTKGDLHTGDLPETGRARTDLNKRSSQGLKHRIVHRNTNHLFDEGIKDVAGKSYDSRP